MALAAYLSVHSAISEVFSMLIRPYAPSDREQLLEVWYQASRVGHPFLSLRDVEDQRAQVRNIYLPQADIWVVVQDDTPVGFIGLLGAFIGGLFVSPSVHKAGIGRSLVEHAARLKGSLEVEVYARNQGALGFYRQMGFSETGRRGIDDQGRALELVRLRRSL